MAYDPDTRWKITDIDVPFGCMLRWLLKFFGCYLLITAVLMAIGMTVMFVMSLLGAAVFHSASQGSHSNHFSDPNYWKH